MNDSNTIVIKYGGAAMTDPAAAEALMAEVVKLQQAGKRIVLVHGGGPEIDRLLKRLGIEPKKVNGLRVTDAQTLEVVELTLAGKANKHLVALIERHGGHAIGLSGRDGSVIKASRKEVLDVDLGFVGTVTEVDCRLLNVLLSAGYTPVICSIAADSEANPLNVNADEVAAAVAVSMGASSLALLTDIPGVMLRYPDPDSVVPTLTRAEAEALINQGTVDRGMIPKVRACIDVVNRGVPQVRILDGRRQGVLIEAFLDGKPSGTAVIS